MSAHRYTIGASGIHGRGIFAARPIVKGERVATYRGPVVTADECANDPQGHTMLFGLGDGLYLDGARGPGKAKFINHRCRPNCLAFQVGMHVEIRALRPIDPGEELTIDYALTPPRLKRDRARYACRCGAVLCRGTMLDAAA